MLPRKWLAPLLNSLFLTSQTVTAVTIGHAPAAFVRSIRVSLKVLMVGHVGPDRQGGAVHERTVAYQEPATGDQGRRRRESRRRRQGAVADHRTRQPRPGTRDQVLCRPAA